jgi:hypothetical protein
MANYTFSLLTSQTLTDSTKLFAESNSTPDGFSYVTGQAIQNYLVNSGLLSVSLLTVSTVATANITLSGEQTLNGFTTDSSAVLVVGNTDASKNGMYSSAQGAWTRLTGYNADEEIRQALVLIQSGTLAGVLYRNTNASVINVGTDAITFETYVPNQTDAETVITEATVTNLSNIRLMSMRALRYVIDKFKATAATISGLWRFNTPIQLSSLASKKILGTDSNGNVIEQTVTSNNYLVGNGTNMPTERQVQVSKNFIKTGENGEIQQASLTENTILVGNASNLPAEVNKNSAIQRIIDADADTFITVEETTDVDVVSIKSPKTGTDTAIKFTNGSSENNFNILGNGTLNLLRAGTISDTVSLSANRLGNYGGLLLNIPTFVSGYPPIFAIKFGGGDSGFMVGGGVANVSFMRLGNYDGLKLQNNISNFDLLQSKTVGLCISSLNSNNAVLMLNSTYQTAQNTWSGVKFISNYIADWKNSLKIALTNTPDHYVDRFYFKWNGNFGVGVSDPQEQIDVLETTKTAGRKKALATKTANYTVTKSDERLLLDATSNTILIQLLDVSSANHGQIYAFKALNVGNLITIIAFEDSTYNVADITDEGGNTFRYTITDGSLAGMSNGDYVKITLATNAANNGTFQVTGTDSATYFEVTNASGVVEATSPAKYQLTVYDYDMTILNETIELQCDNDNNTYQDW